MGILIGKALEVFVMPLSIALSIAVLSAISYGISHIKKKSDNKTLLEYLCLIEDIVNNTVMALIQTTVSNIKASNPDGKLTQEEANTIKTDAVKTIKEQLPSEVIRFLAKSNVNVDKLIEILIEKYVSTHKNNKQ